MSDYDDPVRLTNATLVIEAGAGKGHVRTPDPERPGHRRDLLWVDYQAEVRGAMRALQAEVERLREALLELRDHYERQLARHVPFEAAVRKHYPIVAAAADRLTHAAQPTEGQEREP